jgi:hypothetical protein
MYCETLTIRDAYINSWGNQSIDLKTQRWMKLEIKEWNLETSPEQT